MNFLRLNGVYKIVVRECVEEKKMLAKRYFRLLIVLWIVALLAACAPSSDREAGPADAPATGKGKMVAPAPVTVESIEIRVMESFPVRIYVVAMGYLPDSCSRIDRIGQKREGDAFLVTIAAVRPTDQVCAQVLTPFEEIIPLDVEGLAAGVYTVDVNGVRDTFELSADNVLKSKESPVGSVIARRANVESIEIQVLESFPVQVQVVAKGYVPDGCTKVSEITQEQVNDTFSVTVMTSRPAHAVCTQAIESFEVTIPLEVSGLKAGRYVVDVNGVTGSFELAVDNLPQR